MSRRYGRNQKRKHRQRIADLELAVTGERARRLRAERVESQTNAELIELVRAVRKACPYSALLEPQVIGFDPDYLRWGAQEDVPPGQFTEFTEFTEKCLKTDGAYMHKLRAEVAKSPFLRDKVRVVIEGGGYAVSREVVENLDRLPLIQRELAELLVRQLTEFVAKERVRTGRS